MSDESLFRGYSGRLLVLLSVGLAVIRLGRWTLPPLLPSIISDLSITPLQGGIVLSVAGAGFALSQYPGGRVSDQLTRKTVLVGSLSILVAGAIVLSVSTMFVVLVVGAAILGIGEGLFGAADRGLLSDIFKKNRGSAFGIHTMFNDIGGILAAAVATAALAFGIWQSAFLPVIFGGAVTAILINRWVGEPISIGRVSFGLRETGFRLFLQPRFRWMVFAYSLYAIAAQGFIGFLPALLQSDLEFTPTTASIVFAGMFATGFVVRPLAGRLSDRWDRTVIAGSGVILGAFGVALLVYSTSVAIAIVGIGISAAGQKAFAPTMQAYLMDAFPDGSMAGDFGAMRTVYIGVGSFGPVYVGYVASRLSYKAAFIGFIGAFLLGGIIVIGLSRFDP